MMCPSCIEEGKRRRQERLGGGIAELAVESSAIGEKIHQGVTSITVRLAFVVLAIFIGSITFAYFGPVSGKGPLCAFLYASAFVLTAVAVTTYVWLWIKMFVVEPIMGAIALFAVGVLVWYWAGANPEHAGSTRIAHYVSVVLAAISIGLLSHNLDLGPREAGYLLLHFTSSPEAIEAERRKEKEEMYQMFERMRQSDDGSLQGLEM